MTSLETAVWEQAQQALGCVTVKPPGSPNLEKKKRALVHVLCGTQCHLGPELSLIASQHQTLPEAGEQLTNNSSDSAGQ